MKGMKTLEINPRHPLVERLREQVHSSRSLSVAAISALVTPCTAAMPWSCRPMLGAPQTRHSTA